MGERGLPLSVLAFYRMSGYIATVLYGNPEGSSLRGGSEIARAHTVPVLIAPSLRGRGMVVWDKESVWGCETVPTSIKVPYPRLVLKPGRERSLLNGHPWIFSGAVEGVEGTPEQGDLVCACDSGFTPLALGFFNDASDIPFRVLTWDTTTVVDEAFWKGRLQGADHLRRQVIPPETTAYRLVNAEGDGLPGLVVDRYGDGLVVSIGTAGMDRFRDRWLEALADVCRPAWIYERSEGPARRWEGLEDRTGPVLGPAPPPSIPILEHGLRFHADVISGQKTGFFLDQRDNRLLVGTLCRNARVLNCFSYTGGFSVYAARGGAAQVVSVEASAAANEAAATHLTLNGFSPEAHPVVRSDVFQYLRRTEELYDVIILDPPAFAKTMRDVKGACRGYKDIHLQAMRRLRPDGLLVSFSCSNPVDVDLFEKIVLGAARDLGRPVRLLKQLGPGPDHPTGLAHREGRYLKGLLLGMMPSGGNGP